MKNEDLDLMLDVLALNLITEEVKYGDLNIPREKMKRLIEKFKSNGVVMKNSESISNEFATILINRIFERNGIE